MYLISRTISRNQFNDAMRKYVKITAVLPDDLKAYCPHFDAFIDPVEIKRELVDPTHSHSSIEYIELTDSGINRYAMLQSPYAAALFRVWLLDHNEKLNAVDS